MWFNDEQADSTPINVIAAIIAVDRRPLVRGTVAFTGAVTPAGNITTVDHGLVEQIRDLTIADYRLGSDREKTSRYSLRGRRPRPGGRLHAGRPGRSGAVRRQGGFPVGGITLAWVRHPPQCPPGLHSSGRSLVSRAGNSL